jgi:DNA replication protein DnaC
MEAAVSPAPTLSLMGFLDFLFRGLDGYIYSPNMDRETGEFNQIFVKSNNLQRLHDYIKEQSKETDVFLAPAVFSEPKVSKATFAASRVVWTEFDGNAPDVVEPVPSVTVLSSIHGHSHTYWMLDEPVTNGRDLEEVNRAICFSMGADQSAWDSTQILRPPETYNYKRDKPVAIKEVTGAVYNIGDFSKFNAPERLEEDSVKLGDIPEVMDVIYKYPLTQEFKDIFTANPAEGSRSTYLMRVGYLAAEAGCENEEIYTLLRNADLRWKKYTNREDRHRRLLDIIERARIKYPLQLEGEQQDYTIDVLDIVSFNNLEVSVDWLLPSLLQSGGNMLLVGPPGVGKTQVALNFAYGLSTGRDVLGYKSVDGNPRRVLFISAEMGTVDLKVFISQMNRQYEGDHAQRLLSENFYVLPLGEPMYLNTKVEQDKLKRMCDVLRLDGIIFDSLGSATNKSLSDEESTKGLLDFNDTFRKEMGVFSWFIHHNRKATENNKEPSGLADVYGSQYITARATTVLSLWPIKSNILKVRELKKRLAAEEEDWYIKRTENLQFKRVEEEEIATIITTKSTIGKANADTRNSNPYGI